MFDEKKYMKEYHKKHWKEYYKKIKNRKRTYNKEYYKKNRDKFLKLGKIYREKNKEKNRKRAKEYYHDNKDKLNKISKEYYKNNRDEQLKQKKEYRQNNLKTWKIPIVTNCQICGKEIYFNKKEKNNAIHFDHKQENLLIKESPTGWLMRHKRTPENEKIWESCNFGMLCDRCNKFLPTKNREQFAINIVKYILGKGFEIKKS